MGPGVANPYRGFESPPLRQFSRIKNLLMRDYFCPSVCAVGANKSAILSPLK